MAQDPAPFLIALDWGTTSLRAYLLDREGRVLDRSATRKGVMQIGRGEFAAEFDRIVGPWRAADPDLPAIASGMVGSTQGWTEAGYIACPAGIGELSEGLVSIPERSLVIVPGVAKRGKVPDVMRGEETQVAGVLSTHPGLVARARLVLPGSHSKWVSVEDGRIVDFATYMTGELFAVLRNHSILGRNAGDTPDAPRNNEAFVRGVDAAEAGDGISPLLFSVRALHLASRLGAAESLDYLSGLLIGDELRCALKHGGPPDALVGEATLCERYAAALARFGIADVPVIDNAAPAGLFRIAAAGLPDRTETVEP